MSRRTLLALAFALALPSTVAGQQANALTAAATTLGTNSLRSITFTATGQAYVLGQPPTAAEPWPVRPIKSYQVTLDYLNGGMRIEQVQTMPTPQPRGGGAPFAGEQRQVLYSRGAFAWNEAPGQGGAAPTMNPQPAASAERVIWTWGAAPQGLIKAAGAAATRNVANGAEFSFTVGGRYRMVALINKANHIDRVQTWIPNDVFGDMLVEIAYSGYKNFGPIVFPARIVMSQGGHRTLELTVTGVKTNEFVDIVVPDNVRAATVAAPAATSAKVADGIFWITGGSHHSMAVDMGDHVVVLEAPQNEARSNAVIAETKRVIPNKPIRYVVNTHLHFDHSGGLRTYVDEGATVVTHQANQAFYEKAWSAPRTIIGDRLSKSGKKWTFQGVTDRTVLQGANNRTIELHVLQGNPHNEQTLIAWLPADKILFQSDMMNPPAPNAPVPPPTPSVTNFYDTLQKLNIQPAQIVGGHGTRIATGADLQAVAGKAGTK
jgi:glyoxylase-like metal-dependent hydrolase (beta-lactamase superfamily II)